MPKIYYDEMEATISSTTYNSLKSDSSDSEYVDRSLKSFIESKDKLKGPQWDKVRTKMGEYTEAMARRTVVGEKLSDAIKEALQLLVDYLGDDLMLDTSMLDEYKRQRDLCQNSIDRLNVMLNQTEEVTKIDETGKKVTVTVKVYDEDTIKRQIRNAEAILAELDRLIAKIIGLNDVYAQAENILKEVFDDINEFSTMVSRITPSSKVVYSGS